VEREDEKAQEEEKQEARGSINLGLAAEIVGIVRDFTYTESLGYVTNLYDTKEDIADVLQTFFATGRIDYPVNPQARKAQLAENPPIPILLFDQIEKYIEERVAPDTFILYCLHNDEVMAKRIGAMTGAAEVYESVMVYLNKRAPIECWGSIRNVVAWLNEPGYLDDSSRR